MNLSAHFCRRSLFWILMMVVASLHSSAEQNKQARLRPVVDVSGFNDSSHHWYDINDEEKIITLSLDKNATSRMT